MRTKKLLFFCLLISRCLAQNTPLNFTPIPFSAPDLNRPFAGVNQWNERNEVNIPDASKKMQRLDSYHRFESTDLCPFNGPSGQYDFGYLDWFIHSAIDQRQKVAFGVMNTCCGNGSKPVDGANLWYPLWVHKAMQASRQKDFISAGRNGPYGKDGWVPNYDNPVWIAYRKQLHEAIVQHLKTTYYKGVRFYDIVLYVDALEYGDYGEWATLHGTNPSAESLITILGNIVKAYDSIQVQGQPAMLDGGSQCGFIHTPASVGEFALKVRNAKGQKLGFSDFCLGCLDSYRKKWLFSNSNVVKGFRFDTAIQNRYKYSPMTGEPPGFPPQGDPNLDSLPSRISWGHVVSFGNGNFNPNNIAVQTNARLAAKKAGYRLQPVRGSVSRKVAAGGKFEITLFWQNTGITPTYEHWQIVFELVDQGRVRWTGTSSFDPFLFLPGSEKKVTDRFKLNRIRTGGDFTLRMRVSDPKGYRFPMPLFITTPQDADGNYTLGTVHVGPGSDGSKGP